MTLYSHRHVLLFLKPVVEVEGDTFVFQGNRYGLRHVVNVQVTGSPIINMFMFPAGTPKAKIELRDGSVIKLNGRALVKAGEKARVGFFSNKSDAFDELVAYFKRGTG